MKILYLGNFLEPSSFNYLVKEKKVSLNPSGQNFHSSLAEILSSFAEVKVLSFHLNPNLHSEVKNPRYHYLRAKDSFMEKLTLLDTARQFCLHIKDIQDYVVVFDALNIRAAKLAKYLKRKYYIRTLAVITDKADNLSNVKKSYVNKVYKLATNADAFFTLTKGLNDHYNIKRKPYLILPGILKEYPEVEIPFKEKSYLLFTGALYERYGVLNLLNAYQGLKPELDLVIAGHGPLEAQIIEATKLNPQIHYLGLVSPSMVSSLIKKAALTINPRARDPKLDPYCVPSKLIQYLNSETPILSGPCSILEDDFKEDINWLNNPSEENLFNFLLEHLGKKTFLTDIKENRGAAHLHQLIGQETLKEKFQAFFTDFSKVEIS